MDFNAAGADKILENFIEQNQIGRLAQQFHDVVTARRDAGLVVLAKDLIAGVAAQRPCDPAPKRLRLAFAAGQILAVGWAEKLAVEDGCLDLAGLGQRLPFGNNVERVAASRRVVERSKRV